MNDVGWRGVLTDLGLVVTILDFAPEAAPALIKLFPCGSRHRRFLEREWASKQVRIDHELVRILLSDAEHPRNAWFSRSLRKVTELSYHVDGVTPLGFSSEDIFRLCCAANGTIQSLRLTGEIAKPSRKSSFNAEELVPSPLDKILPREADDAASAARNMRWPELKSLNITFAFSRVRRQPRSHEFLLLGITAHSAPKLTKIVLGPDEWQFWVTCNHESNEADTEWRRAQRRELSLVASLPTCLEPSFNASIRGLAEISQKARLDVIRIKQVIGFHTCLELILANRVFCKVVGWRTRLIIESFLFTSTPEAAHSDAAIAARLQVSSATN